jgi:uncharacterized protein (DUF58 family)
MLLTPETVRDIDALQVFARHIIDGLSIGKHASHHKGFSTEFKEHRSYVPGDQLKSLDWKLYGKTDRLYIKQFEEEINLQCMIAIDCSASMNYSGSKANQLTKYNYACALASCLAYLLLRQQDAVGIHRLNGSQLDHLNPRSRSNYLQDIMRSIIKPIELNDKPLAAELSKLGQRLTGRHLLFIISDLFDDAEQLANMLKLLRGAKHDVVVFQIWDFDEAEFPFTSMAEFHDLEIAGSKTTVNCSQLATAYRSNVKSFVDTLSERCRKHGVDYVMCQTHQTCGSVLQDFLAQRGRKP